MLYNFPHVEMVLKLCCGIECERQTDEELPLVPNAVLQIIHLL